MDEIECPDCIGIGFFLVDDIIGPASYPGQESKKVPCHNCEGTGKLQVKETPAKD